ncbi:MAG: hypothetical protein JXA96_16100 [Sedimentisphaerales bacterium]|nr:hypothetical protein [Sedimentisphaerales bacterium]
MRICIPNSFRSVLKICAIIAICSYSNAQQIIHLEPGWNTVYLEVQPEPADCSEVFQDIPVKSIWMWNAPSSSESYVNIPVSPDSLVPSDQWLGFFKDTPSVSNLHKLLGGKAYLIKYDGQETYEWQVRGTPCLPKIYWTPKSYNFVGFNIESDYDKASFINYFENSSAHMGSNGFHKPVFGLVEDELNNQWIWKDLTSNYQTNVIESGRAYWIYCNSHSNFVGPLEIDVEQGKDLDFSSFLTEQDLTITNVSQDYCTVSVALEDINGSNPLQYSEKDPNGNAYWADFNSPISIVRLQPNTEHVLKLHINRMLVDKEQGFDAMLSISNDKGSMIKVPVMATCPDETDFELWTGTAVIDGVSEMASWDPDQTTSVSSPFYIRLILLRKNEEVGAQFYLLDQVAGIRDTSDSNSLTLITNKESLSQYAESLHSNSTLNGFRISSAAFSFSQPQEGNVLVGDFNDNSTLVFQNIQSSDDQNPFFHRYHPDHDNLEEIPQIKRTLTLDLEMTHVEEQIGTYSEVIQGLTNKDIVVSGTLKLKLIARPSQWIK